jgi:hypothetical protein
MPSEPPSIGSIVCVNGQWVSNSPAEGPQLVTPSIVAINGNLTVEETVFFPGLESSVVNGCVSIAC